MPATTAKTARAKLRHHRGSPQKARLVVDQIRGQDVERALSILRFSPKAIAKDLHKLLWSAVANAKEKDAMNDDDGLYICEAYVDGGPTMKRIRPMSMGRAFRIIHRTSHITLVVAEKKARP